MALLRELAHEFTAFRLGYPAFVNSREAPATGEIPIFVFHTIEPQRFERQLRYLVDNGYRTIDLAEYLEITEGRIRATGREVLLTIDDARSSVWTYAYPLLRRHDCKATLFVITGWTPHHAVRPSLDDVAAGKLTRAELDALDPDDLRICSWQELAVMRSSGLVEVDSHTHLHQRLFEQPTLVGIIDEGSIRTASDAAYAPYLTATDRPACVDPDSFTGYPLLPTVPLMACSPSLQVSHDFAAEVSAAWRAERDRTSTASATQQVRRQFAGRLAAGVTHLDTDAVARLVEADLVASRDTLRAELPGGNLGSHLCLPFTVGSSRTVDIAKKVGFRSILWGVSSDRVDNRIGDDPYATVRLKNDFVWRLPGRGRRSLVALYAEKFTRRLSGIAPY